MKKQLIATSIMLAIAMNPAVASTTVAESDNVNEIIGMTTGAVIGGLLAGPVGLIAAGTIGLFIGHSQGQKEYIEQTEIHLEQNEIAMKSLSNDKLTLEERLAENVQIQQGLIDKLAMTEKKMGHGDVLEQLKLKLQFDVDSTQVVSFYAPQIKHLAMMMKENPALSVNLSGYSDASGSKENNLILSQARIDSVKMMLVNQGIDEKYISTEAFGESDAMQANRTESSDFAERRVDVQLFSHTQNTSAEISGENISLSVNLSQKADEDIGESVEDGSVEDESVIQVQVTPLVKNVADEQVFKQDLGLEQQQEIEKIHVVQM